MAVFVRYEICRIECRHNLIRKAVLANATVAPVLELVSSKHMLGRYRLLEHKLSCGKLMQKKRKMRKKKTAKVVQQSKHRFAKPFTRMAGGGGACRSFGSSFLTGRRWKRGKERKEVFSACHAAWQKLLAESSRGDPVAQYTLAQHTAHGASGTASYKRTGSAFCVRGGHRAPNKRPRQQLPRRSTESSGNTSSAVALSASHRLTLDDVKGLPVGAADAAQQILCQEAVFVEEQSDAAVGEFASDHPWHESGRVSGVLAVSQAPADLNMKVFQMATPASVIGERVLSHIQQGEACSVQSRLLEAWSDLHKPFLHADAPPLRPLPPDKQSLSKISDCRRVGLCLCTASMSGRRLCRAALSSRLREFFVKGSPGRRLYDFGQSVLCVTPDLVAADSMFFFVGFGNLSDLNFTLQPLRPVSVWVKRTPANALLVVFLLLVCSSLFCFL